MKEDLAQAVQAASKELFDVDVEVSLSRPDEQFGDYATNVALQLSKPLRENPREIAENIAVKIRENAVKIVSDVSVAGPGFLNITFTDEALQKLANGAPSQPFLGQTIVTEYSDPNPFKPLHAGHLYTTLVGDTIARLVQNAGAETIRLNFGGDVGRHVGTSMWAIISDLGGEHPEKLDKIPEDERPAWLGRMYAQGYAAFEENEQAKKEIIEYNKRVYELHSTGDRESAFARIYWTCRDWSYEYFKVLYSQLEVVPFDRFIPESEVTPLGLQTVREQTEKGVYEHSDGAVIFDGEKYGLHKRVFINSEGLPTYEAKDVGLSLTKWRDYHFDESIIITAAEQQQYMEVVIKSIEQFAPELARRTKHLTHGTVKLKGGVKMSSRRGNVVMALDILESARAAAQKSGANADEQTVLAAVKYAFAKNRIGGDIIYDPEESVALEGNSGPYIQYAHARARSILAKTDGKPEPNSELEADERSLLRKISEYSDVLEKATQELMPHHICTYLYELAQTFNRFYEKNRVIGDPRQAGRLSLVGQYADTLKNGLSLLGIHAPEKM